MLKDGLKVRQHLAWVGEVIKGIDNWDFAVKPTTSNSLSNTISTVITVL
jgi:hypothetical protein